MTSMVPFRFIQSNKHQQRIFTFTFALGFVYECYILFEKTLFLSDVAFAIALASANDALRPTHTKRTRKQKRKYSRMFGLNKPLGSVHTDLLSITLAIRIIAKNGYSIHFLAWLSLRRQCVCKNTPQICFSFCICFR